MTARWSFRPAFRPPRTGPSGSPGRPFSRRTETSWPGGGPPSERRPRTAGSRELDDAVVDHDRVEALALAAREDRRLDEVDDAALDPSGALVARGHRRRQLGERRAHPVRDGRSPAQAARQHSET